MPLRIYSYESEVAVQQECPAPVCGEQTAGMTRRPLQFYPWIAVDKQGRVGVMWHDTFPDYESGHPNWDPCDGNVIYDVRFAYSLDGGINWRHAGPISDAVSQTGVGEPPAQFNQCVKSAIKLGEYSGLTATSDADGRGRFHAIWTDFREYEPWRGYRLPLPGGPGVEGVMGDIYTTEVIVTEAMYRMGDFDRDYDADMYDYAHFAMCATAELHPECEIMDINRNNAIDAGDQRLFMQQCYTGPRDTGAGAGADGSADTEEEFLDGLAKTAA